MAACHGIHDERPHVAAAVSSLAVAAASDLGNLGPWGE